MDFKKKIIIILVITLIVIIGIVAINSFNLTSPTVKMNNESFKTPNGFSVMDSSNYLTRLGKNVEYYSNNSISKGSFIEIYTCNKTSTQIMIDNGEDFLLSPSYHSYNGESIAEETIKLGDNYYIITVTCLHNGENAQTILNEFNKINNLK